MIALYLPGSGFLHRLPAGVKLVGLMVLALAISLWPHTPVSVLLVAAGVVALYLVARLPVRVLAAQVWLTKWIALVMVVTQLIFATPVDALVNTVRVLAIVLLAALLTLTTRSADLLSAFEVGLRPLRRFGVDPRRVGLTLSLTLAMIPVIADFARRIREAQNARGVRLGFRAVLPLLVMSLRHADEVADALTARGVD